MIKKYFHIYLMSFFGALGYSQTTKDSLPSFARNRPQIPEQLLKDKKEGNYYALIPLVGYDFEQGFAIGAGVEYFRNGKKEGNPLYEYVPYNEKIDFGAVVTTGGVYSIRFGYDVPYLNNKPMRLSAYTIYSSNKYENYFGSGVGTLNPFSYPGSQKSYTEYNDYRKDRDQTVNGKTWKKYNDYHLEEFSIVGNLQFYLAGGLLRPLVGLQFSKMMVKDYTGETVKGVVQHETKLREDARKGTIIGSNGGWNNLFRLGITYDNRDFEPNPSKGIVGQILSQTSNKIFGSTYNYTQVNTTFKFYQGVLEDRTKLVFAGTAMYTMRLGDVPFFALNDLSLPNEESRRGLGGYQTLEGYLRNRFVGKSTVMGRMEVRYAFGEANVWGHHLRFMAVPSFAAGRVYDNVTFDLNEWKKSYSLGFRLAWNVNTVVGFDLGRTQEGTVFYMELGHPF